MDISGFGGQNSAQNYTFFTDSEQRLSCRPIIKGLPLYNQTFSGSPGRQKNTRELRFLDQTQLIGSSQRNPIDTPHSLGDIVLPSKHTMPSAVERGWEEELEVSPSRIIIKSLYLLFTLLAQALMMLTINKYTCFTVVLHEFCHGCVHSCCGSWDQHEPIVCEICGYGKCMGKWI